MRDLIMFETNKEQFIKMLNSLDINNGEFALDFKKLRSIQTL